MKYKNNILLITGNVVSKLGSKIHRIALNSWLISISQNAALLGWMNALTNIPILLFNLVSGYLADTQDKKRIVVLTDMVAGITCIVFALLVQIDTIYMPLIISVNVVLALCGSLFSPSLRALVPAIISKDSLKKTNAILSNLSELIKIIAPAFTAWLLSLEWINIKTLFIVNGISFLISSLSEMFIDYHHQATGDKPSVKDLFVKMKEGYFYLKSHVTVFKLIIFAMITNLFLSGYNVLLPYYGQVVLDKPNLYGIALSFEAVGAILASFFITISKKKDVDLKDIIKTTIPLALSLLIATYPHEYALLVSVFLFGFLLARFNVLFFTYIQTHCDENYLGRVFAVIFTMACVLMPIGDITFGYLAGIMANYSYAVISVGMLIATLPLFKKERS